MLRNLQTREYGSKRCSFRANEFPKSITSRINESFNNIYDVTMVLRAAVESGLWTEIERAVGSLIAKILDNPNPEHVFQINPAKRQEREIFVMLGGMSLLLQLLGPPFHEGDGRAISTHTIHQRGELWNEILVILREVCFAIPPLADNIFSKQHIVFLFTFLHHQTVFENTTNLLEEILAVRIDTFSLSDIPDFYGLIEKFTTRQLAHFCRVLALVLFEPEDRQIMECSQVLKSFELLQLRRDRMAKASNTVERNQSLIISMPQLLSRLICLLRIINYGPTLADLIRHNIVSQTPLTSDILYFLSSNNAEASEWQRFIHMDSIVRDSTASVGGEAEAAGSQSTYSADSYSSPAPNSMSSRTLSTSRQRPRPSPRSTPQSGAGMDGDIDSDDIMNDLLAAFSPNSGQDQNSMSNLWNVMNVAQSLGLAHMNPLADSVMAASSGNGAHGTVSSNRSLPSAREAKKELQFHAMILAPHQVELLFVLCTLLSGRRKIDVQQKFAALGLAQVLGRMYDRLSWEAPPYAGPNPLEHIHGPGCECNPESALRVQYLRLVHNFYDRDFHYNPIKTLLLSPMELSILNSPTDVIKRGIVIAENQKGLLSKIIDTLLREPMDSIYRFWLSSCLEAYLRGSGSAEQMFVVRTGVLSHLTSHIMANGANASSNLQTAFDLLGELTKCNLRTVEMLEETLVSDQFRTFMDIVMSNLVDSNVFLRTLFLSMEHFSDNYDKVVTGTSTDPILRSWSSNVKGLGSSEHLGMSSNSFSSPCPSRTTSRCYSGSIKSSIDLEDCNPMEVSPSSPLVMPASTPIYPHSTFSFGYLTHTWIQPNPMLLSQRAVAIDVSTPGHLSMKSGNRRASFQTSRSSFMLGASALSSFSDGVRDAFRGLRDAASQLLGSPTSPCTGSNVGGAGTASMLAGPLFTQASNGLGQDFSENGVASIDVGTGTSRARPGFLTISGSGRRIQEDSDFSTPLASPPNGRVSMVDLGEVDVKAKCGAGHAMRDRDFSDSLDVSEMIKKPLPGAELNLSRTQDNNIRKRDSSVDSNPGSVEQGTHSSYDAVPVKSSEDLGNVETVEVMATGWQVPDSVFRLSLFLVQERDHILLKLMNTVTIQTVNHENICCLNTALLILILAQRRGQLSPVLRRVRVLSKIEDEKDKFASQSQQRLWAPPSCTSPMDVHSTGNGSNAETLGDLESAEKDSAVDPGDTAIFRNFRELLWYWCEYYMRRGRDRLSLEFSSQLQFHHWNRLVGTLCADDGTATSLLSKPIQLPQSPYLLRPRPSTVFSEFTQA